MRRCSLPIGIIAIACGLFANAQPAQAGAATWVSGTGTNAGSCPITAPCRTFHFAHSRTDAGGVINVLSPGSFGALTITKSISIVADGVEALFPGSGSIGAAIKIEAGAGDVVSLRGLIIDLRGTGGVGIDFVSGAALHVHNTLIRRAGVGLRFAPASGTSELYVADSVVAASSATGIEVRPTGSGGAKATLDRVRVEKALHGIGFFSNLTTGAITATVRDSVSAGNTGVGIGALEDGGTTTVVVDRSAFLNNNNAGIQAIGAGATIRVGDSTVSGNGVVGLEAISGGVIESYLTNKVNGNTSDGAPTSTIAMK